MSIAICNFIRFKDRDGVPLEGYSFQNFFIQETRQHKGIDHLFAPFGVTSGAGTKGGDRSDAALVAPATPLAVNLFVEASRQGWICEIRSVLLDPETYGELATITVENWVSARPELNVERAVLRLASPLDAVDTQIPKRTLSNRLVGNLPSTGTISVS